MADAEDHEGSTAVREEPRNPSRHGLGLVFLLGLSNPRE
jgi:hypothetical protein